MPALRAGPDALGRAAYGLASAATAITMIAIPSSEAKCATGDAEYLVGQGAKELTKRNRLALDHTVDSEARFAVELPEIEGRVIDITDGHLTADDVELRIGGRREEPATPRRRCSTWNKGHAFA